MAAALQECTILSSDSTILVTADASTGPAERLHCNVVAQNSRTRARGCTDWKLPASLADSQSLASSLASQSADHWHESWLSKATDLGLGEGDID